MGEQADYIIQDGIESDAGWGMFRGWKRSWNRLIPRKPSGPGPCPKCGGETHHVMGKFGDFYGCDNFPNCKGSRNL